jgi:predicted DNA-binding transcriptional regulator YafY
MLRLLSLLQTHRYWSGTALAERLEVSPRTLRRDVDRLRQLGYPVDASRGTAGGYQLQAGAALPPLLLDDDEAVAIAVGLRSAAGGAVAGIEDASVSALGKLVQVMPPRLRRRVEALQMSTVGGGFPSGPVVDATTLTVLAQACRDDERVRFSYTPREGEGSERFAEPHRLVSLGRRWYLVAYDLDRGDWRSFRVDRISAPTATGARFRQRDLPAADAAAFVKSGIRSMQLKYEVVVAVSASAAAVKAIVWDWGVVTPTGAETCELRMSVDTLTWPVMVVASLGVPFEVISPPELIEELARTAALFSAATTSGLGAAPFSS